MLKVNPKDSCSALSKSTVYFSELGDGTERFFLFLNVFEWIWITQLLRQDPDRRQSRKCGHPVSAFFLFVLEW